MSQIAMDNSENERARFVLNPEVILRDESRYQSSGVYLVRISRTHRTWCVDEVAFNLLVYLAKVRELADLRSFYSQLSDAEDAAQIANDFKKLMVKLIYDEIISCIPAQVSYTPPQRPTYLQPPPSFKYPSFYEPLSFPMTVAYVPFAACNLRCRHCQASKYPRGKGELSLNEIKDLLVQTDEAGTYVMKFTGGEPTLHPRIWDILQFAASKRFSIELLTNATLINEKNIDILVEITKLKDYGFTIGTSLDGATAESHEWMRKVPGSFAKTKHAMELMSRAGVPFSVGCTVSRKNLDELEKVAELLLELGATSVVFVIACSLGNAPNNLGVTFLMDEVKAIGERIWAFKEKTGMKISFSERHTPFNKSFKIKSMPSHEVENPPSPEPEQRIPFPPRTCPAGISTMAISSYGKVYPCIDAIGADNSSYYYGILFHRFVFKGNP